MLRAKALYKNLADTPEELSFDAGDILVVLEQDVAGAAGWWLCSVNGRSGIAPGNRLRLLPPGGGASDRLHNTNTAIHGLQQQQLSHQVIVPHKAGNVYVYDIPHDGSGNAMDYDVPPSRYTPSPGIGTGGIPLSSLRTSPRQFASRTIALQPDYDVPPSAINSRKAFNDARFGSTYDSPSVLSNRMHQLLYDVPPGFTEAEHLSLSNRSSVMSNDSRSSLASFQSGSSASMSARSSADISLQDVYDIPRSNVELQKKLLATSLRNAGISMATIQRPPAPIIERDSYLEDYSVPRSTSSSTTSPEDLVDSGIEMSKSESKIAESVEIYDTPRTQTVSVDNPVYDVPPNVSHVVTVTDEIQPAVSVVSDSQTVPVAVEQSAVQLPPVVCKHCIIIALREVVILSIDSFLSASASENRNDIRQWCVNVITCGRTMTKSLKELVEKVSELSLGTSNGVGDLLHRHKMLSAMVSSTSRHFDILAASFQSGKIRDVRGSDLTNIVSLVEGLRPLAIECCTCVLGIVPVVCVAGGKVDAAKTDSVKFSSPDPKAGSTGRPCGLPPAVLPKQGKSVSPRSVTACDRPLPAPPPTGVSHHSVVIQDRALPPPPICMEKSVPHPSVVDRALPPPPPTKMSFPPPPGMDRALPALPGIERPLPPPPSILELASSPEQDLSPAAGTTQHAAEPTQQCINAIQQQQQVVVEALGDDYDYVSIANEAEREIQMCSNSSAVAGSEASRNEGCVGHTAMSATLKNDSGKAPSEFRALNATDRELLSFYAVQVRSHVPVVESAVSEFYRQAAATGPVSPELFVQRSKLVVLAAHKLVYIGDTIARHVTNDIACQRVAMAANALCDCLKCVVMTTKESALLAPHNAALRLRAIDSVKAAAAACNQLNDVINAFLA